jgi:hypothetical protein
MRRGQLYLQAPSAAQPILRLHPQGVPRGFRLKFLPVGTSGPHFECFYVCDHTISDVGVMPGDGTVTVTYADHNRDDDYEAEIAYAYVPRSLVAGLTTVNGESGSNVGYRT